MGYAKYFEDNEKIQIERNYERNVFISSQPDKTFYDCYYCNKSFESFELRNKHIRNNHNIVGPLLLINEKICVEEYYVDKINSAKIILCGFNDISIIINQKTIDHQNSDIDLIDFLDEEKMDYNIIIGNRTYCIKKYNINDFITSKFDEIINSWEEQILNNQPLSNIPVNCTSNEAERNYLNGFYEYYTACKTEIEANDKQKRYETAYSLLSRFETLSGKANVVLQVISFRLNWMDKLINLTYGKTDCLFNPIIDFLKGKESKKMTNIGELKTHKKLYIEDELEDLLNAIYSFQKKDWNNVDEFLKNWKDSQLQTTKDINLKDKILFYKLRRFHILKNHKLVEKEIVQIKSPFFKEIAKIYTKQ